MTFWATGFWATGFWSSGFWGDLVEYPQVVLTDFYVSRITGRTAQTRALQAARLARQGWAVGSTHALRRR